MSFLKKIQIIFLVTLFFMNGYAVAVTNDYGNTSKQEYGDVVYNDFTILWAWNYNHAGIYAGINSSDSKRVIEAVSATSDAVRDNSFDNFTSDPGGYYGAYTLSSSSTSSVPISLTFTQRKAIVQTGRDLVADSTIGYPGAPAWVPYDAIDYAGTYFDGSVSDIDHIRCDGVTEYCYEKNGHEVWWNTTNSSAWNISNDTGVELHNDMPDVSVDPHRELSPWAQRGSPPNTGPNSSMHEDNSYLISDAVIDLPTYEVSTWLDNDHMVVQIRAKDVKSGIHQIGYMKPGESSWSFSKNVQHPSSDTYTKTYNVYSEGWFNYFAQDNGGNYPETAEAVYVQFPEEIPSPPSLSSPSNGSTANGTSITFQWSSSSGATNYHLQLATDSGFSNLSYDSDVGNTTSIELSGFSDNGTKFYWRVKAGNSAGWSSYSTSRYFYNGTVSPPSLSSPSNGSTVNGTTIQFRWNESSGGDSYYLQVATDSSFNNTIYDDEVGLYIGIDLSGFPDNGTRYYWRVKAENSGRWSGYSSTWYFDNGTAPVTYTLSVNSSGTSGVSISSSTGHGGTTNYTETLTTGTNVTLTAPSSAGGKIFTGWTGDVPSGSQTISFSMNGTKTVTANYVTPSYTLSVNSSGASGVSISSSTGHGGTTNYTKTVTSGTTVTLTAPSSASGKTFTGWTGDVPSGSQTISFSMNGTKTVTANYATSGYTLTTSVIGGNGTLSPPSGGTYGEEMVITLTAVPDIGYRVKAWNGTDNDSSTANTNTVTMNSNKSVTVEFEVGQEYPIGWNLINFDLHNSNLYPYPSAIRVQDVPFTEQWSGAGTTMKTGDIDGDGFLELVTSDGSNLYVYDGNGVIEWQMATTASLNILADVTGDGTPEILMSIKDGATARIEAYDGTGPASPTKTFATSVDLNYGNVTSRGVSDLNEDGVMELIASKGAAWVQSRGVIVFDCATTNELWYYDIGPFVPYPAVGDVTGLLTDKEILHGSGGPSNGVTGTDGSTDNACYAFLLDATGSSLWRKQFEGSGFVNASAGLCDIDNDGRLDVIATSFSHGFNFWDGSLGRVYILDPTTGEPISGYEHNFSTAVTLGGFADLDEDGISEILINKKDGAIQTGSVIALSPISGLPVELEFSVSGSTLDVLFINDLNGDGKLEVIVKGTPADGSDHTIYVLDNELNLLWHIVPGGSIQAIVSDLNQNGRNEIILSSGGSVYIFEGNECCEMAGDFDDDCDVDTDDLSTFVTHWLEYDCIDPNSCGGADLNTDFSVNFLDFTIFAEDWLVGFVPALPEPEMFYSQPLDSNPNWTTEGLWAFGQPAGGGGAYGGPDPTSGYTGTNVYGYNLAGDYENNLVQTHLTSDAIDCTGQFNVHLKFRRWLGVESPTYDHAYIQVSNNGADWTTVWQNTGQVSDTIWMLVDINISSVADDHSTLYLRWTMGSTDDIWEFCGWNIDDIELWGTP